VDDDLVFLIRRLHTELVRTGGSAWNDVADEMERLRQAERALADQLAYALNDFIEYGDHGSLRRAKEALAIHKEARRG